MPRLEATVSEITVPTKASVTATFSEAKKYGMVRGRPTLNRMSSLLALSARITSSSSGSVVASPVATFTTIGKTHMIMRGEHRRDGAGAEPQHEDRHHRDLRDHEKPISSG